MVKTGVKVYHYREKCLSLRRNDTTWQLWEGRSLLDGSMFYFISLFIVNQIDVVYRAPAGPGGERRIYMRKNFSQITTGKEMKQTIEENPIWIPLQTTYCKELQVAEFLRDSEIPYYIPQTYELQDAKDGSERCERILVPAIHNLLFIRCSHYDREWCRRLQQSIPFPTYFMRRGRESADYCIISNREMQNFMRATNPEIQGTRFIDPEKLKNKKNVRVRVVRKGPLFGMEGQFVRYGGRHYIAIQVSGSAALLKVSYTWCELIEEI